MSSSYSKRSFPNELDAAFDEIYANFETNFGSTTARASNTSVSIAPIRSKIRKLDDEEVASQFPIQAQLDDLETSLFAEYISRGKNIQPASHLDDYDRASITDQKCGDKNDVCDLREDDNDDDKYYADTNKESSCIPCSSSTKQSFKSSDSDLKNYAFNIPRTV